MIWSKAAQILEEYFTEYSKNYMEWIYWIKVTTIIFINSEYVAVCELIIFLHEATHLYAEESIEYSSWQSSYEKLLVITINEYVTIWAVSHLLCK